MEPLELLEPHVSDILSVSRKEALLSLENMLEPSGV